MILLEIALTCCIINDSNMASDTISDQNWGRNNPFNVKSKNGLRSYMTPENGIHAGLSTISKYLSKQGYAGVNQDSTLLDLMGKWAPVTDRNNPVKYAAGIANEMGLIGGPTTQLKDLKGREPEIAQAMMRREGPSSKARIPLLQSLTGMSSPAPARNINMPHPHDFTDIYNTPIPAAKQDDYNKWVQQRQAQGHDPIADKSDYDVQGYWLGTGGATDDRGHGTDIYKKPNHPTFSDESKYHGADGYFGGRWMNAPSGGESSASYFQASPTNLKFMAPDQMKAYMVHYEPDTQLLLPPQPPIPDALK